jgi:uncharacterized protein
MITRGSSWSRPALVMVLYLGLGAAALLWSSLRGAPNLWRVAGREDPQILTGIVAGLFIGLGVVFLSQLSVHRFEWARELHREFRSILGPLPDAEIVVLAGASAVGEEMFFRGALMPALAAWMGSAAVGLWVSSAIFALLHIGPKRRHLPWTATSLLCGVMFGQLTLWTGDLTGAVVAHFTVNFLNLRHVSSHDLR